MNCSVSKSLLGWGRITAAASVLLLAVSVGGTRAQSPIRHWEVAGPYPGDRVDREAYPHFYSIFMAPWQEAVADSTGVMNLGNQIPREHPAGDLVIARHVFYSSDDRVIDFNFGFAEQVTVFLNGSGYFLGRNSGDLFDQGFPWDHRGSLEARKGLNEIFLMVTSGSDQWGYAVGTNVPLDPVPESSWELEELWVTPDTFLTPESVLKDPTRDVLYVSSFDNQYAQKPEPSGYISRLALDGTILDHQWVDGLNAPTGMDIWRDTLFVAEREHLLAIDLASGAVAGRWPIPDPVFPNDLVIDHEGAVYISDTRTNDWADSRVYRFRNGEFDIFANEGISRANGLWIQNGWLIVGSSGDGFLKRVELTTGRVEPVLSLGAGIIDGIRIHESGDFLVSHWEGQLYRIAPDGHIERLLNGQPDGWNTADFEYLPEGGVLFMPTFLENTVRAMRIRAAGGP